MRNFLLSAGRNRMWDSLLEKSKQKHLRFHGFDKKYSIMRWIAGNPGIITMKITVKHDRIKSLTESTA